MSEVEPYGTKALPELYKEWASTGMVANIGTRLVEVKPGSLVLEGNMTANAHGFPTSRGPIVHGGAIATLADESLASVAFTLADVGETTTTADALAAFRTAVAAAERAIAPIHREFFLDRLIIPELRQGRPIWCS